MLKGKNIILGVTGSIAAYKAASLASLLVKAHANVNVIMTPNATQFITPLTFEELTGNRVISDTFFTNFDKKIAHIALARSADLIIIAPCTANVIGKLAGGIADDMLTTTMLPATCPKYLAPAMNTFMFENPIVQDNLEKLKKFGYHVIEPASGRLACNTVGKGKLPEPDVLFQYILKELAFEHTLCGKNFLVTAGPTQEAIDPVRFITNHSSGKMGYAIARAAMLKGANVTLVTGPTAIEPPMFVNVKNVVTADEMYTTVMQEAPKADFIFKVAAVADYTPAHVAEQKLKKTDDAFSLELLRTKDILGDLGKIKRDDQILCGFSMETENLIENSRLKRLRKNADIIVANSIGTPGTGFASDNNTVTILAKDISFSLSDMPKEEIAERLVDFAASLNKTCQFMDEIKIAAGEKTNV